MGVFQVNTECLVVRIILDYQIGSFVLIVLAQDPIVTLNNCRLSMLSLNDAS